MVIFSNQLLFIENFSYDILPIFQYFYNSKYCVILHFEFYIFRKLIKFLFFNHNIFEYLQIIYKQFIFIFIFSVW